MLARAAAPPLTAVETFRMQACLGLGQLPFVVSSAIPPRPKPMLSSLVP